MLSVGGSSRRCFFSSLALVLLICLSTTACPGAAAELLKDSEEGSQSFGMVAKFEGALRRLTAEAAAAADEGHLGGGLKGSQDQQGQRAAAAVPDRLLPQGHLTPLPSGFIHYSSFCVGLHRYAVLGLGPASGFRDLVRTGKASCVWTNSSNGSSFSGRLQIDTTDSMRLDLITLVLFCDIAPPQSSATVLQNKGWLQVSLGSDSFVPYAETQDRLVHAANSTGPFANEITFCGGPMHGQVEPLSLVQWLQYHLVVGIDHLVMYNVGAIDAVALSILRPFTEARVVTVVEFSQVENHKTWYHGQMLALHDCNFRSRESAAWVIFGDLDEYLVLTMKPQMGLKAYMKQHQEELRPWLSRGSYRYRDYCLAASPWGDELFAVEVLQYRGRQPDCWKESKMDPNLCVGSLGRRKMIVNPRMVEMLKIHDIQRLSPSALPFKERGIHLHVSRQLHNAHFSGVTTKGHPCRRNHNLTLLVKSNEVRDFARRVKKCLPDPDGLPRTGCGQLVFNAAL